jgi:hypothetical protein
MSWQCTILLSSPRLSVPRVGAHIDVGVSGSWATAVPLFGIASRALVVAVGGWIAVHLTGTDRSDLAIVAASGLIVYGASLTIAFRAGVWQTRGCRQAPASGEHSR